MNMLLAAALLLGAAASPSASGAPSGITVRTENYPRPPYSGATYYIYERSGATICTKLEVCNKFDDCDISYHRGAFKESEDRDTGAPYDTTAAVPIATAKLSKHVCLVKFGLNGSRR